MKTLRIAGVPEHFNYPWRMARENGDFERSGIDLKWTDVPEGTGKLCQMLRDGETDVAIILTEGIIRDIVGGNPSKIVQVYVESPLLWGIHVAAGSRFQKLSDLRGATAAISRSGSGSHLMAYVNAANQGWDTHDLGFEVVHTIGGAVEALASGRADYFMWERFMTKPLVDDGTFRRLDDCPTPWPCFVVAVRDEMLERDPQAIKTVLSAINSATANFKKTSGIAETLAREYGQKNEDIRNWLSLTEWSQKPPSEDMLNKVQNQLLALSLIAKKGTFAEIAKAL
jgi:ABC-type nitrate/sulfonate/bicarbonate transport system substrate-binding protein